MSECQQTQREQLTYDTLAGPVYASQTVDHAEARRLVRARDQPQIVEVLVCPHAEAPEQRSELRRYYVLNLPQAAARAAEIDIRLREQELRAAVVAIRPATGEETNVFFRALDILETAIPVLDESQVKELTRKHRTHLQGSRPPDHQPSDRNDRVDSNYLTEGA